MSNKKDTFNLSDLTSVLNEDGRADLVNVLKNKLQDLTGKHSDVLENLSPLVRKRVEVLRELQSQHDELESKFFVERAALEAKYQKLYQPLYAKRYEIVNGVVEVEEAATETAKTGQEEESADEKGVRNFWLTAMKNNEIIAEEISEHDEEALKFLKDIKWSRISDPKVKCLTETILEKKPKKGSKSAKPFIMKTEKCNSFFNFFSPPQVPEDDDDIEEDAAEELQNLMEQDYEIGSAIRDKIIPHAVSWFTGEAVRDEFVDVEDDDDDIDKDEDEEEEDEDEDEEEEDEDHPKNRKKKSGRAAAANGQQAERPPECKQQ